MGRLRLENQKKHPLLRQAKWIILCGVLGGGIAFTNTYLAKPIFRTKVQVLVSAPMESLGLGISFLSGNTATPVTILQGLFESPALVNALSHESKMEEKELSGSWFVQSDPLTNQIELTLDHHDPKIAAQMISKALEIGKSLEVESSKTTSKSKAAQLKESYEARLKEVEVAEEAYRKFLTDSAPEIGNIAGAGRMNIIVQNLRARIRADESKLSQLRANARRALRDSEIPKSGNLDILRQRLAVAESNLDSGRKNLGPDSPELKNLEEEYGSLKAVYDQEIGQTFRALESDLNGQIGIAEAELKAKRWKLKQVLSSAGHSPKVATQMESLTRQLRSAYKSASEVRAEYESARAESIIERSNWQRISTPFVLEKPINKGLIRTTGAGFILGAFFASLATMLLTPKSAFTRAGSNTPETEGESWNNAA